MPSSSASRRMVSASGPSPRARRRAAAIDLAPRGRARAGGAGRSIFPGSRPRAMIGVRSTPCMVTPFIRRHGRRHLTFSTIGGAERTNTGWSGGDPPHVLFRGVGADPVEEHADLHLPPAQVGPQDRRLLAVGQLVGDPSSRRRPRSRASRPPSARTLRTHWPSPRGDTRYWSPSNSSRLTGVRRGSRSCVHEPRGSGCPRR